jgi:hypothetical protein
MALWKIAIGVFAVVDVVILYSLCAMSAKMDQADEDRYGVEKARRS